MTKTTTNKILLINIILFILAIISNKFWTELGLTDDQNIYYALYGVIIYGLSVGGVFVGFKERKEKGNKYLFGLIGNSILSLIFLFSFLYVVLDNK
ncbi:hypothetical protein LB465_13110 [Salegentibacter sp. LM13S]|uniref:hypothetical protein n=1 Tax=Salegentibacter lacus TaxID=2873599 RepID=UPI001CCDC522|nr:hypothetical protein [Salegentibacter lacus]MBZ9631722.1 hypothetical protein [Salegentibacter lacus]